jgi:cytochrome c-type biogenesis protein CcsB
MESTLPNSSPNKPAPSTLRQLDSPKSFWAQRTWFDWLFAVLIVAAGAVAFVRLRPLMDVYELAILVGTVPSLIALGWVWRPLSILMLALAGSAFIAVGAYSGVIANGEKNFLLKYLFSSQSAILWMSMLFIMALVLYWVGLLARSATSAFLGTAFTWGAVFAGWHGLLARWHESYLMGPDLGHIPVSNLYEVFVLFCLITAMFYLYYEVRYQTRSLGGFVSIVVVAAVGFLLWYTFDRQAHEIQPLVPALQSWWMKLHVPANFIGYGTFSLAAMVAFAYLVKFYGDTTSWLKLMPLWVLGIALAAEPFVFRKTGLPSYWALYFAVAALLVGLILVARKRIAPLLPSFEVLDDVMYKAIAIGFAFFTIATILGALWAAEAWGTYWQWDPKETWALIVWLNYAAWLHMRLVKSLAGPVSAYWALIGLLVTGFAFLGVNMFLSGLHSYGEL